MSHPIWSKINLHKMTPAQSHLGRWSGAAICALDNEANFLLLKRSQSVPTHRGQLAFPGGHRQEGEDPAMTATREFVEETGIGPQHLQLIGQLAPVPIARGQVIIPLLARTSFLWREMEGQVLSYREWDVAFSCSLVAMQNQQLWTAAWKSGPSGDHPFYFRSIGRDEAQVLSGTWPWPSGTFPNPCLLWGATAQMIQSLLTIIA